MVIRICCGHHDERVRARAVTASRLYSCKATFEPERGEASTSLAAPAPSEVDQAIDRFKVNAVAVRKEQCLTAADGRVAPGTLPMRPAPTIEFVPLIL